MKQNLIEIEEAVLGEVKKVENLVSELEKLSTEEVIELAEKTEMGNDEK